MTGADNLEGGPPATPNPHRGAGTAHPADRPPYLPALGVFITVLAGYVWTLAPTVTFWDAGEFIATAKILGIPHPPGTPLFVLLGHVWADLVRIGEYAYRTNLMTATFSAAAAAWFFLVVAQALAGHGQRREETADPIFRIGGATAAALLSAFAFTVWQNSNETEVYMVAAFSISAIVWLAWAWRKARGTYRAPHILLLIVYLAAVSIGNHLLTLLVGPALIGYMWHVMRTEPLEDERARPIDWAQWAVLTGIWALLIGAGLGSTSLLAIGGVMFVVAAAYAASAGSLIFAVSVFLIALVGASTYFFLYVRAGLSPFINEADPSTLDALLEVIRREQYPARSPVDNPIYPSGPENPGRSLALILLQARNYIQYFDWQWANGLAPTTPVFAPIRLPFTLLFTSLGIYGARLLRERDRSIFWLLLLLWLTTGPGLMGYMNFKPGFSLGWAAFPSGEMHEVRERDYFFTVSFQVWGLFAGIGLAGLYRELRKRLGGAAGRVGVLNIAPAGVFVAALIPLTLNFHAASRAHGPEATLARDFAYDLLQTIEPYGIVFTNGDNDTFPLWYLQEVEEIRRDVSVVNLSLANTRWYVRQLRENPVRPLVPDQVEHFASLIPEMPPPALHSLTDVEIDRMAPQLLPADYTFRAGPIQHTYAKNSPLYVKDIVVLRLIQENRTARPVYFGLTAGRGNWVGLGDYLTQHALALRLHADAPPDSSRLVPGVLGVLLDLPRTDSLAWQVYRYSRLLEQDTLSLGPTEKNIASNLSLPFISLGQAYELLGDRAKGIANLQRAYLLSPNPQMGELLRRVSTVPQDVFLDDTAAAVADR